MDRRRYIPHVDGLESRMVLSAATASAASQAAIVRANAAAAAAAGTGTTTTTNNANANPNATEATARAAQARAAATASNNVAAAAAANAQNSASAKAQRIQRLPFLLYQTSHTRVVPPALVQSLQYNLTLMINNLRPPNSEGLRAFNNQLRATMPRPSIRLEDAVQLNGLFGKILADAGTVPWLVQKFQADMNELARIDSFQRNSAALVANDYGLMLQVVLGAGVVRPGAQSR